METLRRMMPQRWGRQDYERVDTNDILGPDKIEKHGVSWQDATKRLLRLPLKTMILLIAAVLLIPGLLALTAYKGRAYTLYGDVVESDIHHNTSELATEDRRLATVLPANNPDHDLCKVIISTVALGYPCPVIVNWGKTYDKSKGWKGGSHLAKITGTLEYLDEVSRSDTSDEDRLEEHDIVVLTDSYDVWFQLPPDVLLNRYHEANKQANQCLAAQWKGYGEMPMQQTIIVSAQKKCFPPPSSGSVLHCDELPESPARKDLYGPDTDKNPENYHDVRPKYLNSGSMMGPLGDMRRYFRRVQERMQRGLADGKNLYSDQGIFGEIFAEQEIWRRWRRTQSFAESENSYMVSSEFEYHVGLDYKQNLFIPTVFEEQDGEIVVLNNKTAILEKSQSLEITPRLNGVPDDLQNAKSPLSQDVFMDNDISADWGEMPLYADFYSTAIPVVIHHNAHKDGAKKRRYLWWDRIWFFPYLRELIETQLKVVKPEPLVEIVVNREKLVYWESRSDKPQKKPKTFVVKGSDTELIVNEFIAVCRAKTEEAEAKAPWYDEVFRDGKGAL